MFKGEKLNALLQGLRIRQEYLLSPLLFIIVLKNLARAIRGEEVIQIGKGDIKLSLFVDDMILYIKNSMESKNKLLELINRFRKLVGYKINT